MPAGWQQERRQRPATQPRGVARRGYRSSHVDLDGRNSPRIAVVEYARLPPGKYEISGVLVGIGGKRATAMKFVHIVPTAGSGRY